MALAIHALRAVVAQSGFQTATARPPGSEGRAEQAGTKPARLVEDSVMSQRPIGSAAPCPEPLAFLDGIQRHEIVGYGTTDPIVGGVVAAGIRERRSGRLETIVERRLQLVIGRRDTLADCPIPESYRIIHLPDDEPSHPIRDSEAAVAAVDRARVSLEAEVARDYRTQRDAWLVVDGALADHPGFDGDPRMIGVAKSHATLPFAGPNLEAYLRLPVAHRSSVFEATDGRHPVYAWGLRLWPWEGRDLLFGLVRVEVAHADGAFRLADEVSRWLLAERAPISSGDGRWDRLLYGIHSVEEYLRASQGLA